MCFLAIFPLFTKADASSETALQLITLHQWSGFNVWERTLLYPIGFNYSAADITAVGLELLQLLLAHDKAREAFVLTGELSSLHHIVYKTQAVRLIIKSPALYLSYFSANLAEAMQMASLLQLANINEQPEYFNDLSLYRRSLYWYTAQEDYTRCHQNLNKSNLQALHFKAKL